jgi:hypothetical protein
MPKPYELEKALLEGNKIQGLQAPSENAYHQISPIPDYFLVNSAIPNSQIKPSFDFIFDSILLFSTTGTNPTETVIIDVFSAASIRLYTLTIALPTNNLSFTDIPEIPFEKGSRIALSYSGTSNDTINAKLFLKRVYINEI